MIEVERKFLVSEQQIQCIKSIANFVEEVRFTDIYYDTMTYSLTGHDIWLRQRQGKWELKVPVSENRGATDIYHEITDIETISDFLEKKLGKRLEKLIAKSQVEPFVELTTQREKYKYQDFNIDIDTASAENFSYSLLEIEKLVKKESERASAACAIEEVAKTFSLATDQIIPGKVLAFLKKVKPDHYHHLLANKVVRTTQELAV